MTAQFIPTRTDALQKLNDFISKAGTFYSTQRNYDRVDHNNVSCLSPYIRHRNIHETEILKIVLEKHSFEDAEKFIQEVYWRSYWKGWLAMRPALWPHACKLAAEGPITPAYTSVITGQTGIDCFDAWVSQLLQTGYLHNHARMWFASIWIFTLGLPWAQGAAFFMQHLLDGDPASNTLSWRWVAGLHTQGKYYLATAENIKKYTDGRFNPIGLTTQAKPLTENIAWACNDLEAKANAAPHTPYMLLISDEDMESTWLLNNPDCKGVIILNGMRGMYGPIPSTWKKAAMSARKADLNASGIKNIVEVHDLDALKAAQAAYNLPLVSAYIPDGYLRDAGLTALNNITFIQHPFDAQTWPHATRGFFTFRTHIQSWCEAYKS